MPDFAINAEGLGKKYTILHEGGGRYRTLREAMASAARNIAGRLKHPLTPYNQELAEEFWALKEVCFEVKQGDRLGIIGRNGTGKSTLLKVLSRITEPSTGRISINGRVASLLEVGTGFHPELSGRENIFLNGAILGMKRSEIKNKFDEIVDFAGIAQFLDTPVKRYSSGMYVRLAFAVAAHLEPEILVIDEVLAVGDAEFQKKCLGKMEDVSKNEGRTVLFVSHNMGAVKALCNKGMLMEQGRNVFSGSATQAIDRYIENHSERVAVGGGIFELDPNLLAQMTAARICRADGHSGDTFECDEPLFIVFDWHVRKKVPGVYGYLIIRRMDMTTIIEGDSHDVAPNVLDGLPPGTYRVRVEIPSRSLGVGEYEVYMNFTSLMGDQWTVHSPGVIGSFTLVDTTSKRGNNRNGYFSTLLPWLIESKNGSGC